MADAAWMAEHRAHQVRGFARRYVGVDIDGRRPGVVQVLRTGILQEAAAYGIAEDEVLAAVAEMERPNLS